MSKQYCLEISGDFACFTRPEMKVERVSYDVITPSAARAVFEAILWKPAIRWQIRKIEVLKPIRWINLRRNEVGQVISTRNVQTAMKQGHGNLALNIEDERQQRAGLFLRDVKYRIHASFVLQDDSQHIHRYPHLNANSDSDTSENSLIKFQRMFERRASKGQCFNQPYLGCREFSADFRLVDPQQNSSKPPCELSGVRDLGWMLYDLDYSNSADPTPRFFQARMNDGVIIVPEWNSAEVRG
ncbi:MAG: type I-C CRISPR-associated protein Cas5 [Gammaproteobacteria bacterium]|nr:type I-C CRISPR-associated protein Cas5 [Gammaproteobacteria bacterium]MBQ0839972.1 type I-C CRISPR-associated protein Cas5 [Gammaproteobacteria bacterium]